MARKEAGGGSGGAAAEVKEKGAEVVSAAQEQVQTKAAELKDEGAFQLKEQMNERSTQMGEQVDAFGRALRTSAEQLRSEGKSPPAKLVEQAADRAEDLGSYLRSADGDEILRDLENFARRRPWLVAGVGLFVGFVASRVVKASSDRRYEVARGNGGGTWPVASSSRRSYEPAYSASDRSTSGGTA